MIRNTKTLALPLVIASALALVVAAATAFSAAYQVAGAAAVLGCALAAVALQLNPKLNTFAFTMWVFAFFLASLVFPDAFLVVGGFDQRALIVPLIQIIMFGMGATLSLKDFSNALKMPKAVLLGIALQFAVMPLVGWSLAMSFGFEAEIATGIILIGSCSGGVASNVMAYLSRGNVALSVTMTACSTLLSPLVTPFAMKLLAGQLIEINVLAMFISIIKLIILPIAAGLLTHYLLHSNLKGKVWRPGAFGVAALFFILACIYPNSAQLLYSISVAFALMGVLRQRWLEKGLPVVSMAGICYIVAIIAASTRTEILAVGIGLFAAALIHNLVGYVSGYWISRASGLSESDCRTVSFEVGMQNGGMGAALAIDVLKSSSAALGPVIFGTWMNLTGSALASWWKGRPPKEDGEESA